MITYFLLTSKELSNKLKTIDFNQDFFNLFNYQIFLYRDCNNDKDNLYYVGISEDNELVSICKFEKEVVFNKEVFYLKYLEVSGCHRNKGYMVELIKYINLNIDSKAMIVSFSYDVTELGSSANILGNFEKIMDCKVMTDFDNFYKFYKTGMEV